MDLVERLHEDWKAWGSPTDRAGVVNESAMALDCYEAAAEIEKLRAIVDKLPKTADGVPIVCDADGFVDPPLYWFDCGTAKATFLPHEHGGIGECYSTPEAAIAAGDSDEA